MKLLSSKRRVAAAAALIVLALFLLRPGASSLKSRIITSISAAVGRPVDIGSVHIRLLPRPGFDLENLVVYDDAAFGAEPILRASEVTADLRLLSLARGRLEIARLDLTEPSLNLVHSPSGRWNLEALLERTAHIPLAPTAKAKSEPRPGFPYIEATSARINFKSGPEKKPYALTNADFSLWQESENAWGVRLKAQPFRTDLNLNDTGLLQVNGTWQRAAALRDTPLQFTVEWSRAQLGQFTKFFTGNDKGWRGAIQLDALLEGTPATLRITSAASVEDFRRYDIMSGRALRLAGKCDGKYSVLTHEFHEVMCSAPVADGVISLRGDVGLPGSHHYGLVLTAENLPASAAVMLAQRAKKNLPEDLAAEGTLGGSFSIREDAAAELSPRFEGRGEITDFRLASAAEKAEIGPETVLFVITDSSLDAGAVRIRKGLRSVSEMQFPEGPHVEFGPVALGGGRAGATVRGWINRSGYNVAVLGETEIARALRQARMIGVPALPAAAEGSAQVDLQISGSWLGQSNGTAAGFAAPQVSGSAKLRNVHIAVRGAGEPVEISSADIQLSPDAVRVGKLNAKAAGSAWTGSLEMPRGCGTADTCPVHFALHANQIVLSELSEWATQSPRKRPWYRVLEANPQPRPSLLASLRASGRVTADDLLIKDLAARHVSAQVSLQSGKLQISALDADLLDGKHHGQWQADFRVKPAICSGSGNLTKLSLTGFASAMKDPAIKEQWMAGTAKASYEVKGLCSAEFWQSAEGTLQFDSTDGTLPHLSLGEDTDSFRFTRFAGQARLTSGKLEISDARLDSPDGKYLVSGTASLLRELDLRLVRIPSGVTTSGYAITGTVAEPRVAPLPGTEQARLKPLPSK